MPSHLYVPAVTILSEASEILHQTVCFVLNRETKEVLVQRSVARRLKLTASKGELADGPEVHKSTSWLYLMEER